jgi:excisionase family DNA binding protein
MTNTNAERRNVATTVEREWLSYKEAQEFAGLGRTTLWSLVSQGLVPAAKIGRSVRISKQGLEEYMRGQNYVDATRK